MITREIQPAHLRDIAVDRQHHCQRPFRHVAQRLDRLDRRGHLVEGGRHDLRERTPRHPPRDAAAAVRGPHPIVDRADREVVGVAGQVIADVGFPGSVVGDLHAEPDRHTLRSPALCGSAHDPLGTPARINLDRNGILVPGQVLER